MAGDPHFAGRCWCGVDHMAQGWQQAYDAGRASITSWNCSLDAAWAEVEAALPEGWSFRCGTGNGLYWADAISGDGPQVGPDEDQYKTRTGATIVEALNGLAVELRSMGR
jgi:hypothetical protein